MKDLTCPLCGETFRIRSLWCHLPDQHGMPLPKMILDSHQRWHWLCVCGREFPDAEARAVHFRQHGRECLVLGLLRGDA